MKTKLFFFLTLGILASNVQAKIWRVNSNTNFNADFPSLQLAINTATAGDTLYIEGSSIDYSESNSYIDITKKLVLIGPGYFLADNDSTQFSKMGANIVSGINIYPAASGTILEGLKITDIQIGANNITLQRNNISNIWLGTYFSVAKGYGINLSIANPTIKQNYIRATVYDIATITNGLVSNNIVLGMIELTITSSNYIIENNIVMGGMVIIPQNPKSSIFAYYSLIQNNICKYDILSTSTFNIVSNNFKNLQDTIDAEFIGGSIPDKKFMLAKTSVAKGAADNGLDCGPFAGADAYVLSGLPPIPHIWFIQAPITGTSTGLPVKIKVKTQN